MQKPIRSSAVSTINRLIAGYNNFKAKHFIQKDTYTDLVEKGQKPEVMIIACSDSRVDPAIVMQTQPGELFIVRNVANLVPPYKADPKHHGTSAALEFAVNHLGVRAIVLFGHTYCGGIQALMSEPESHPPSDFIHTWMDIAMPAKRHVLETYPHASAGEQVNQCEKASLVVSLENLQTFPWIQSKVQSGALSLHAWCFDLGSGDIEAYDASDRTFKTL